MKPTKFKLLLVSGLMFALNGNAIGSISGNSHSISNVFETTFSEAAKSIESKHQTKEQLIGLTDSPDFNVAVYKATELNKQHDIKITHKLKTGNFGYLSTSTQIGWRITPPAKGNTVSKFGGFSSQGKPTSITTKICQAEDSLNCFSKMDSLGSRDIKVSYPQQAPTYVWLTNGYEKTGLLPNTNYVVTYTIHVNEIGNSVHATYGQTIELTA